MFTFLFNFVDFISASYYFGINFWYLIYAIYAFGKLMDGKKITTLRYISFIYVAAYAVVYCFTLRYQT